MDFTTQVLAYCHKHNGGTFDFNTKGVCEFGAGFFVSKKGGIEVELLTAKVVDEFVRQKGLDYGRDYLGIWFNAATQTWFLDATTWIKDFESALDFGKLNDQLAIWNCQTGVEICLKN